MHEFELGNTGDFVYVPKSAKEVDLDKYIYGLFSLLRRTDYIRHDGYAHDIIDSYAEQIGKTPEEIIKAGKENQNILIDYTNYKKAKKKAYLHDALGWLYNQSKEIEIIVTGVRKFYGISQRVCGKIMFGDVGALSKEFHGELNRVTLVDLYSFMVGMIKDYEPDLRYDQDCHIKHAGRKMKIPTIQRDKVLGKDRLPELNTMQVLKVLKIEYRMNKEGGKIDDLEEVYPSGTQGWELAARNEFQKILKKLALILEDKKDPMPFEEHKLDKWIDDRMYFLGGYDSHGQRTKKCIDMKSALDCLFFLTRTGTLSSVIRHMNTTSTSPKLKKRKRKRAKLT